MKRAESSAALVKRGGAVLDAVMRLEARLEALQDLDGLLHGRLGHVDFLEAARQRVILLEDAAIFVIGGRADALQRAGGQRGLEQVGGVQRAAGGRAGADQRMDFVDEQDGVFGFRQLLEHRFQALLEIAAVLGAGQQRAHVERIHMRILENLRHIVFDDAPRQAFGDGGFAHAGLADQQRIVLAPAAQGLDDALQFEFAPDQRIDLAGQRLGVEIQRVVVAARLRWRLPARSRSRPVFAALGWLALGDAVRDEVDHIQPRDAVLVQEIHRMRILLAEDGDQHVGSGDFFLVGRLHMQDGALDDALEAQRGLGVDLAVARQYRRVRR